MIPYASQRANGQDLATHLSNSYDNELVEVAHVRGAVARDLHGAFKEWEVQAQTLTHCEKYLYSLSINPDPRQGPLTRDQYMDYLGRAEEALGLEGQPRAMVFHNKNGREHCHVIWSRIDADNQRAVHLAFDREKLMQVTREFARDHNLRLPPGYEKSRQVGQVSQYDQEQHRQTGLSPADHKQQVTEAWQQSDDAKAFVQALAERGYLLAIGERGYVLVNLYGNVNSLPKLVNDKSVRTKDIRAFLEKDFPAASLPNVEQAQELVGAHRKLTERSIRSDQQADRVAELKQGQHERRQPIEQARKESQRRHQELRQAQDKAHRAARDALRTRHLETSKSVRAQRHENRPRGLADFLGKVTGINLIRHKLHRHQDAQRLKQFKAEKTNLKREQAQESRVLDVRLRLQAREIERQLKSLGRVDKRELTALARDGKRAERVRARARDENSLSLAEIAGAAHRPERSAPDLLKTFERAKQERPSVPDLTIEFGRAANPSKTHKERDDSGAERKPANPHERDFGDDHGRKR